MPPLPGSASTPRQIVAVRSWYSGVDETSPIALASRNVSTWMYWLAENEPTVMSRKATLSNVCTVMQWACSWQFEVPKGLKHSIVQCYDLLKSRVSGFWRNHLSNHSLPKRRLSCCCACHIIISALALNTKISPETPQQQTASENKISGLNKWHIQISITTCVYHKTKTNGNVSCF